PDRLLVAHPECRGRVRPTAESTLFVERWILVQVVGEGSRGNPHRTRRLSFHVRQLQHPTNRLAFDPLDVLMPARRRGRRRPRCGSPEYDRVPGDPRAGAQDDGSFDGILEPPDVAGP